MRLDGTTVSGGDASQTGLDALAVAVYTRVRTDLLARGTPLSTYRVQLHKGFSFEDARRIVPYLARLGVSDIYCSPYLKASPGSTHGYDCVDHKQLNPEVGSPVQHEAFCNTVREHGLGQVLDVVPNHMGIETFNPLWFDVLENGPSSVYARFFDVDWHPVKDELAGKVLLPVLGDQYGVVLEKGELKLGFGDGAFVLHYYDRLFPVAPRQYERILARGLEALEARLGPADAHLVELQSILTAIHHLPPRTETDRARSIERNREKEVIKRRLAALVAASPQVAAYIAANVEAINGKPGDPRSFDELDAILEGGSYRLAQWRVAGEEINYRRFFDINGLAAMRVEDPEVFAEAHQLIFEWLRKGQVTGLRIDHPDGLYDPTAYFLALQERFFLERARAFFDTEHAARAEQWPEVERRLRERWRAEAGANVDSPLRKALYVAVEKIQGGRERIPESWAVHGTTGYRFANAVGGIFVQPNAEGPMTETYHRFIGEAPDFEGLVYEKKRLIMHNFMSSELNMLAHRLNRISEMNRRTRDFTLNSLRRALTEFIALFPVYRTYVDNERPEPDERDVRYIKDTLRHAKARNATLNVTIFDFLGDVLLRRYPEHLGEHERAEMLAFAMKVQQVTGPVMAKGLEDTVFYVYQRMVSLNEVGGEPEHFGTSATIFHERNHERAVHWPASMLTSSTHDTKRSEDVRARLNVLSELPEEWRQRVEHWSSLTRTHRSEMPEGPAPSLNDEYLFYQTVVGAWPMGGSLSGKALEEFRGRIRDYMLKAIKEAKVRTSWTNPDKDYEEGMSRYVEACLDEEKGRAFLADLLAFKRRIERPGQHNALGQLLMKLMSPGVVDTYQGCELWDLSLVDPDNRRPVDYALRERMLRSLEQETEKGRAELCTRLVADMEDGRIKLFVLTEGLRLRQRQAELFRKGGYRALSLTGPRADAAVAFSREHGSSVVIAVAPRYTLSALESGGLVAAYEETSLELPASYASMTFRDVFTGQQVRPGRHGEGAVLPLSPLLVGFPLVLLEKE
ncbi:Malto-oligosyltrehalose synthase [Cystobacter fuscus DSM 2262]|uniref:Malto-oligosyltrehalose synthase n=1 Tax=Cystobacter fuscus (strain ATCC 25194 / DSM 2262 / NBRC 100088 / M29) TaxID=1242864 RepID=S9PF59_CYSF2|nr:malto-oligosyltrehalose synthase [Cystobacter fuscus]EPX61661.1 Malto-oligosyltrehalose synthase [Cystobacter fuscus DSM 2262]